MKKPPLEPLSSAGEEGILRLVRRHHGAPGLPVGIGDDAAMLDLPSGRRFFFTTDLLAEGVHFRRSETPPEDLGYKLAAVNASDIAAMGGLPLYALLSLALPPDLNFEYVRRLSRGLAKAAGKFGMKIVGGDTSRSQKGIFASLSLLGTPAGPRPLTRSGARPGDMIFVTGHLGASTLGLTALRRRRAADSAELKYVARRHLRPDPPVGWGAVVARKNLATSAMDVSDGLSTDLDRLCRASAVGAEIFSATLPFRPHTKKAAAALRRNLPRSLLHGGEEYELLFTVEPAKVKKMVECARRAKTGITHIGTVLRRRRLEVVSKTGVRSPLTPDGWEHF